MNVVIVSEIPCCPTNSGSRLRIFHLLVRLARRHQLTYICRADGDEARQTRETLTAHNVRPIVVEDPTPHQSSLRLAAGLAANLFSSLPYSVVLHNSRGVHEAIRRHAAEHPVDLWQFEWLPYVEALADQPNAVRIFSAHDVVSLLWQRHYETARNPLKRWFLKRQWQKFEHFEGRICRAVDCVVAVSDADAQLFRERFGVERVEVVANGVPCDSFQDVEGPRLADRILYLGALDSRPNMDAVELLLEKIFPAVRAIRPSAQLLLVGRNPPAWMVRRAAQIPGVELHANVADVRPYLATSSLLAVPLRIGGGSRVKILEAFAAGLPVVSTKVGAEGLAVESGRELLLTEDEAGLKHAILECLDRPQEAQQRAECARQLVGACYDWVVITDKLEQVWHQCLHSRRSSPTATEASLLRREALTSR